MTPPGRYLEGKVAIVTGSTRGLGRAFAGALAAAGASVTVNGRDKDAVERVAREIEAQGGRCLGIGGSVASWDVAQRLVGETLDCFGRLDALVNNAAVVMPRTLHRMSEAEWDAVIGVQLKGSFACAHFAAEAMRRQKSGRIVNLLSRAFLGAVGQSNNAAAKGGLLALTWTWAAELAPYGIAVNGLLPMAQTELAAPVIEQALRAARDGGNPNARAEDVGFPPPQAVAPLVVYLAGDEAGWINGQILDFDGRELRLWRPPERTLIAERAAWSLDELRRTLPAALKDRLIPGAAFPRVEP
jgi:NAD(P)-dependent dehydrogenase (short-subunit alcohol dehydrogenase family)